MEQPRGREFESRYLPLLQSVAQGRWDVAESLLSSDKDALKARVSDAGTVLHVAVGQSNRGANRFVEKVLNLVAPEELRVMTDAVERTVLHQASLAGNADAVRLLVKKNRELLLVPDGHGNLPIHSAAMYGHEDVADYLLRVTPPDVEASPFSGDGGFQIFNCFIQAEFYDLAVKVVEKYPELAKVIKGGNKKEYNNKLFGLGELARTPSSFYSATNFHLIQRFLYHCIPIKSCRNHRGRNVENQIDDTDDRPFPNQYSCWSKYCLVQTLVWRQILKWIWEVVPCLKKMIDLRSKHYHAKRLLKCLCEKLVDSSTNDEKVTGIIHEALHLAAENGIHEIAEEVLKTFPFAMWYCDGESHNFLDVAILNRREKVFNLIYQMSEYQFVAMQSRDSNLNHSLHLAAKLAPPERLDKIPGAALQMQRELQWFEEVKKFIKTSFIRSRNRDGKTPQMIFREEHRGLVSEGEKWMKGMAKSCITAATLLTTLAFAAAITIPGGNKENNGSPNFTHEKIFIMFVVSNAISLFSSVGAIIMFLSILTSRYAVKDFISLLPRRLIFGLASLFLSITSMMIAFGGAIHLVLNQKQNWVLVLVGVLAWLPMTLFVTLQFPLLLAMVKSTFGPSIFGRQNKVMLY